MQYMKLALRLAEEYRGKTSPNPMVGAVVVKNGEIIGKGVHQFAGGPHAEVTALKFAAEKAHGATLYVTMEPCCHFGKTPPCTDLIIESGISKVIVAASDPNPLVNGRGIMLLRRAGIEVETGLCEKEAKKLNAIFYHYMLTHRPFVIAKAAISLDGKIATANGDSKWISNDLARQKVHQLRSTVDAVLVGKNTFLQDNPRLNVRLEEASEGPQKIILIPKLDVDINQIKVMNAYRNSISKPLIVVCQKTFFTEQIETDYSKHNIWVLPISGKVDDLDLVELMQKLGEMKITSLFVEGGSRVFTAFLKADLINSFHVFQAPVLIGNDGIPFLQNLNVQSIKQAMNLSDIQIETIEDNIHWQFANAESLEKEELNCVHGNN